MLRAAPHTIKPMQMINPATMNEAVTTVKRAWPDAKPKLGIILGSGWSEAVEQFPVRASLAFEDIPTLGRAGVMSHAGRLLHAECLNAELFIFQGRRHLYEGEGWSPVVLPVWILNAFGADTVLLTNASGGIREDLKPGSLMVIEDHINMLGANPLTGPLLPDLGTRFPDQTAVYNPELRQILENAGAEASGIYLATGGPSFETPAEIRVFRSMGADAVGMSTVPEAILANALGMRVAGLSWISNRAAGLGPEKLTGEDIVQTANDAMPDMRAVLNEFVRDVFAF